MVRRQWHRDTTAIAGEHVATAEVGDLVSASGTIRRVPVGAQAYLVAHRIRRLGETQDDTEPFLADKGQPMGTRRLAIMIADALEHVGFVIDPDSLTMQLPPNVAWLDRRGVSIILA